MSELFFTSDLHLGHFNIIKYCNRPFKTLEEMNKTIIRKWNERVKPNDTVIHVGDFCFKTTPGGKEGEGGLEKADYWRSLLNGNIVFIKGNHDRNNNTNTHISNLVLDRKYYVIHNPAHCNLDYELNIVGHVHNLWKIQCVKVSEAKDIYLVNVGVDVNNFYPKKLNEVLKDVSDYKKGLIK